MAAKKRKQKGKSALWVAGAGVILVALFGWGCMASAYVGRIEEVVADAALSGRSLRGRGLMILASAMVSFVVNFFTQIPNLFAVIAWNVANRKGLLIVLALMQLAVIGSAAGLNALERQLAKPVRRGSPPE